MNRGIVVDIPECVYVSYDASRTVENEFFFTIYKEFRNLKSKQEKTPPKSDIILSPTIYISGFEQFLKIKMKTPEEQEKQITEAAERFLESLVPGEAAATKTSSWSVSYRYDRNTEILTLMFTYADLTLAQDFSIKFSSGNFVCNKTDTQNAIVLTVRTEGFDIVFDDAAEYQDYRISANVSYAPCITKFSASCAGEEYTGDFYVNPHYDDQVMLQWEIAGNGKIEHSLRRDNQYIREASTQASVTETVKGPCLYTLSADNQKGFSDRAQIGIKTTRWHKAGAVSGLFDVIGSFEPGDKSKRIFTYKETFYCYKETALYQSTDGCVWTKFSENTLLPSETDFCCLASGWYENMFFVMGGVSGKRLKIMSYDFGDAVWSCKSAYQNCISEDGSLAFSSQAHYYAQTSAYGITVSGHKTDGDWEHWNLDNFMISPDGYQAVCMDLCFWKDSFYAAVLGSNDRFYFYKCEDSVEDALFYAAAKKDWIFALPVTNGMYVAVKGGLYDVSARTAAEGFFPPGEGVPWLGSDREKVFGIFPDGNFWIYTPA